VTIALRDNPESRSSEVEIEGAKETRSGVRGHLLPSLRAEGHVQQWNSAFELPFALPGTPGPPPVLTVRDAFTWDATVSVMQPVTGLLNIYDRYKVESLGVDVAQIKRDVTRRDLAFRVGETYLRLLESERLAEIAKASIVQLEAQRKQAQSLLANGVIGKNDELRAELALASAKQREIQGRGQVVLVRGRLAALLGLSPDTPIEPAPVSGDPPAIGEPTVEIAESKAASQRLEIREVTARIGREDARVSVARTKLYPNVSAIGSYQHVEGSAFAQKNAAFVGLVGSWDVWDWGATSSGIGEAESKREQARLARTTLENDVRLEARKAFVDVASAREALAVAKTAVAQAEENYRIVTKRFEAAEGTSFDVVDAEALLTQARGQVEDAYYGYLIARMALQRATGAATPTVR
jgi:outer membrane protein TolC